MHSLSIVAAAGLAFASAAASAASSFGTSINTSLRRCNVAAGANCPGGQLLKAVRPGGPGMTSVSGRLDADAGTAQAGSYATGLAELRGFGLPVLHASAFAAGNSARLVGSAQAWQGFTYTGAASSPFSLGGRLHFNDSSVSPVNELAPGGAAWTSYIYIWDAAMFPINVNSAPFFGLAGFDTDPCSLSGMLGAVAASGIAPGGRFSQTLRTKSCSGQTLRLTPGQSVVVQSNFNLFVNRGGFIDASNTFTTILDPDLGTAAIAELRGNLTPASGAVPEPASWAMLVAGFGLIGAVMRRRSTMTVAA